MSKSVSHLFADITAHLEDLHGIAVEGQRADLSPDMAAALVMSVRTGIAQVDRLLMRIEHHANDRPIR
ncbi:MAG: hypothetical protein ACTHM0_10300 [Sphingomonas sp.]